MRLVYWGETISIFSLISTTEQTHTKKRKLASDVRQRKWFIRFFLFSVPERQRERQREQKDNRRVERAGESLAPLTRYSILSKNQNRHNYKTRRMVIVCVCVIVVVPHSCCSFNGSWQRTHFTINHFFSSLITKYIYFKWMYVWRESQNMFASFWYRHTHTHSYIWLCVMYGRTVVIVLLLFFLFCASFYRSRKGSFFIS